MERIAVYDNVKRLAKASGIPISLIEKKAGLSTGSICKWNTVSPTANNLLKVAKILECSVNELLLQEDST